MHELIPGVGILPLNGLHKEVPPERGAFFRLWVYERAGISLVEVCERVGKSITSVLKEPKGLTDAF